MHSGNDLTDIIKREESIPDGLKLFIKTFCNEISGQDCAFEWNDEDGRRKVVIETEKTVSFTAQSWNQKSPGKLSFDGAIAVASHKEGLDKAATVVRAQSTPEHLRKLTEEIALTSLAILFDGPNGKNSDAEDKKYVAQFVQHCDDCDGNKYHTCTNCNGGGYFPCHDYRCVFGKVTCMSCSGRGQNFVQNGNSSSWQTCPNCFLGKNNCPTCQGTQKVACTGCNGRGRLGCSTCNRTGFQTTAYWTTHVSEFTTRHVQPIPAWFERDYRSWIQRGRPGFPHIPNFSPKEQISVFPTDKASSGNWTISISHEFAGGVLSGKFRDVNIVAFAVITDQASNTVTPVADVFFREYAEKLKDASPDELAEKFPQGGVVSRFIDAMRGGSNPADSNTLLRGLVSKAGAEAFAETIRKIDGRYLKKAVIDIAGASFIPLVVVAMMLAFCDIPYLIARGFGSTYYTYGHLVPALCFAAIGLVACFRLKRVLKRSFAKLPPQFDNAVIGISALALTIAMVSYSISVNAESYGMPNRHPRFANVETAPNIPPAPQNANVQMARQIPPVPQYATVQTAPNIYPAPQSANVQPAANIPPELAVTASGNRQDVRSNLLHRWSGYYVCKQGRTGADLTLTEMSDSGTVRGSFKFYNLPGMQNSMQGSYHVIGSYDFGKKTLRVNPAGWIDRPQGYSPVPFDFATVNEIKLEGSVAYNGCNTITLNRRD